MPEHDELEQVAGGKPLRTFPQPAPGLNGTNGVTSLQERGGWLPWAAGYLMVWGLATGALAVIGGEDSVMGALVLCGVFACVLPGLVWLLTRKTEPPVIPIAHPGREMAGIGVWLVIYAVVVLGWLFTEIKHALPLGTPVYKLTMLGVKLAVHVVIPVIILKALGGKVGPLFQVRRRQPGTLALLLVIGALSIGANLLLSPWLKQLTALHPSVATLAWATPGVFIWMAVEAGLCEEVLFRAILQSRLAAVLKSEAGAAVIAALLFALAHVPGLYLRPDAAGESLAGGLPGIIAYTIGVLSPLGLIYGVIWARTRNLWLLVILHATVDFLPNLADFIKVWS
jgi:membrane protease YdiL (CAAX protease family)